MRLLLVSIGLAGLAFLLVVALPNSSNRLASYPPAVEGAAGIPLSNRAEDLLKQTKSAALQLGYVIEVNGAISWRQPNARC